MCVPKIVDFYRKCRHFREYGLTDRCMYSGIYPKTQLLIWGNAIVLWDLIISIRHALNFKNCIPVPKNFLVSKIIKTYFRFYFVRHYYLVKSFVFINYLFRNNSSCLQRFQRDKTKFFRLHRPSSIRKTKRKSGRISWWHGGHLCINVCVCMCVYVYIASFVLFISTQTNRHRNKPGFLRSYRDDLNENRCQVFRGFCFAVRLFFLLLLKRYLARKVNCFERLRNSINFFITDQPSFLSE